MFHYGIGHQSPVFHKERQNKNVKIKKENAFRKKIEMCRDIDAPAVAKMAYSPKQSQKWLIFMKKRAITLVATR